MRHCIKGLNYTLARLAPLQRIATLTDFATAAHHFPPQETEPKHRFFWLRHNTLNYYQLFGT